jgi:Fur family transcriptional regulator, peroxide stress response regulator
MEVPNGSTRCGHRARLCWNALSVCHEPQCRLWASGQRLGLGVRSKTPLTRRVAWGVRRLIAGWPESEPTDLGNLWYNRYSDAILIMIRRQTKQRDAILRVLNTNRTHPAADWIYEEVKKEIPNISKGTVYRNLQVLQEDGVISTLDLSGTLSRYEVKQKSHYHFRCEKCGRIFDLDEPIDNDIDAKISRQTGFKVSHHQTEFRGFCKECQ